MDHNNPEGFYVFEDFLDKKTCEQMTAYVDANAESDQKPSFRFLAIPSYVDNNSNFVIYPKLTWDPEEKIQELISSSEEFVNKSFNLWGVLKTVRVHGNIMDQGSQFYYHTDEDPNDLGEYDGAKRTYVGDLFLNDDYKGGDFGFEVNGELIKFKPKAGSLVIFNGYNTMHGIDPITFGRRINIMCIMHDIKA